ncbi:hypothetical protein ACFXGT_03660 [Streptomyces sp. NPDC059352]|uniref:hypothetical protein n=1 Tax=Streptomyces sp. NPDC059352 TaxID=3346810 RepID=UPI0036C66E76
MVLRRVRTALCPALLSVALFATGCSNGAADAAKPVATGTTGSASASAPAGEVSEKGDVDQKQAGYFACLADQGLPMKDSGSGIPVVDSAKADAAAVKKAETACAAKLDIPDADAKELAAARELTACMRRNGITRFPDPDPKTGDHDVESIGMKESPEAMAALKKCGVEDPTKTDGKVGG